MSTIGSTEGKCHRPRVSWRLPLRWQITTIFAGLVLLALVTTGGYSIVESRQLIDNASLGVYQGIRENMVMRIGQISASAHDILDLIRFDDIVAARDTETRLRRVAAFQTALVENPHISAIYVGYRNGDFLIMRVAADPALRRGFGAPASTVYIVQAVERKSGDKQTALAVFFDRHLREIGRVPDSGYDIDPRERGWYKRAVASEQTIQTDPYVFFRTREIGTSFARRSEDGNAVIGIDFTLKGISSALATLAPTRSARLLLFTADKQVVASNIPDSVIPVTDAGAEIRLRKISEIGDRDLWKPLEDRNSGPGVVSSTAHAGNRDWRVSVDQITAADGLSPYLGIAIPVDELLAGAVRIQNTLIIISLAILAFALVAAWALALRVSEPLKKLADQARATQEFDFSDIGDIHSRIVEVHDLSDAMRTMQITIRRFLEIGRALTSESDLASLLDRILAEMVEVSNATGGFIYLREDKEDYLRRELARTRNGPIPNEVPGTSQRLAMNDDSNVIGLIARRRTMVHRRVKRAALDAHGEAVVSHLGLRADEFESIAIPLLDRRGEVLGAVLLLIERSMRNPDEDPAAKQLLALLAAITGSASIAVENSHLLTTQKQLIDGLIELIAGSIDAKSPYTGGHCQRVPVLAHMLAEAACNEVEGPFKDFQLDDLAWESLRIASWLHDCGKITTPEYVVDKATKLETIYNRIHEIRTRFELVKREFEIGALRARLTGEDLSALERETAAFNAEIDDEFRFVAECNIGDEFMAPEKLERLQEIMTRTWTRTLDDRLGLSHEELARVGTVPSKPLPVLERVIDDKPEHIVRREAVKYAVSADGFGFKLDVPDHRYDFGEIHNLSISRGTLTSEERFIINDHIVQTIMMLESLPFPRHLSAVPEIAGGHHERMDGGGYPRRRMAGDMSLLSRIMAVADVFEALTACDRPYKKAKSLSEAIRILGSFKRNGHLDPDLVDLFLTSEVWKHYAERFLNPEQLDQPDIAAIVGIRPNHESGKKNPGASQGF